MRGGQINLGNGVSIGIMTAGTCRAFGDICLGVVAWRVAMWTKSLGCMSRGVCRHFLSIVGLTSMAMACAIMAFVEQPAHQHVALILFFCCVSITGSRTASVNSLYKPGLCGFLGKWSLSIFLTHSSLRWLLLALSRRIAWLAELMSARDTLSITALIAIYLSSSLVLGLVGMLICEPLQKRLSQCH